MHDFCGNILSNRTGTDRVAPAAPVSPSGRGPASVCR